MTKYRIVRDERPGITYKYKAELYDENFERWSFLNCYLTRMGARRAIKKHHRKFFQNYTIVEKIVFGDEG